MKKPRFCTMYLPCSNVELIKDVGQIPYTLSALYGWESCIVGCYINKQEVSKEIVDKVNIYSISKFVNKEITGVLFLLKHAREFDYINFYHGGRTVLYWAKLYHFLNPNGKVFLKLDMDFRLCDLYDVNVRERNIFKKTVDAVDIVTVESETIKNRIQKYTNKKIELLSNGFENIKKYNNIQYDKENYFLTVGRLGTKQKATEILLEAFALSAPYHDWKLRLVGTIEKEFYVFLDAFFKRYPYLENRIFFLGEITNRELLYEQYAKAKVFILPSMWESFGLVSCEALAYGCRVIVTNKVPPMNEFTCNKKFGEIVQAGNVKELSDSMVYEAQRSFDGQEIIDIHNYAIEKFSWDAICEKLHEILVSN